ncbi:MAG: hypothetical protein KAU20_06440, partial [Nanoarchaeota archaeon]|nr:hypothetical protein [Nanoarchaeota archaeon]
MSKNFFLDLITGDPLLLDSEVLCLDTTLTDLANVNITDPILNQGLHWDGSQWINQTRLYTPGV